MTFHVLTNRNVDSFNNIAEARTFCLNQRAFGHNSCVTVELPDVIESTTVTNDETVAELIRRQFTLAKALNGCVLFIGLKEC